MSNEVSFITDSMIADDCSIKKIILMLIFIYQQYKMLMR